MCDQCEALRDELREVRLKLQETLGLVHVLETQLAEVSTP